MPEHKTQREWWWYDLACEAKYTRLRQAQKIKEAKQELIEKATSYRDHMDRLIKRLTETMEYPDNYAQVNVFGELQNVSEFEARVGRLFEMVVSYNDSQFVDKIIEELE